MKRLRAWDAVPEVPTPTWGRDELATGDMGNSPSAVAWILVTSGIEADEITPPMGGRAPGWSAGTTAGRGGGGPEAALA